MAPGARWMCLDRISRVICEGCFIICRGLQTSHSESDTFPILIVKMPPLLRVTVIPASPSPGAAGRGARAPRTCRRGSPRKRACSSRRSRSASSLPLPSPKRTTTNPRHIRDCGLSPSPDRQKILLIRRRFPENLCHIPRAIPVVDDQSVPVSLQLAMRAQQSCRRWPLQEGARLRVNRRPEKIVRGGVTDVELDGRIERRRLHKIGFTKGSRLVRRPRLQRFRTQLRNGSKRSDAEADLLRKTSLQQQQTTRREVSSAAENFIPPISPQFPPRPPAPGQRMPQPLKVRQTQTESGDHQPPQFVLRG